MAGPSGEESDTTTVTASGFRVRTRINFDRSRAVAADVLDYVGDQLGCDGRGIVCVLVQPVKGERGPDAETCRPHRFGNARQHECDQP